MTATLTDIAPRPAESAAAAVAVRRRAALTPEQVAEANALLEGCTPQDIVRWALDTSAGGSC